MATLGERSAHGADARAAATHSHLIEMARVGSDASRSDLVNEIADLFVLDEAQWSESETVLFNDVLEDLLERVDVAARERVAMKVADCARAEVGLHERLAEDEARVAAPVLSRSTKLGEPFLVRIATTAGNGHRIAIGCRDHLGEILADTLVALGDLDVRRQVADNPGARLSERSLSILTETARRDATIRNAISSRKDLSPQARRRLFALVGEEGRAAREDPGTGSADEVAGIARKAGRGRDAARPQRRDQRVEVLVRVQNVRAGRESPDGLFVDLADADRTVDLATAISMIAGISERLVSFSILKVDPEPIVCICRLLDLEDGTVEAIAGLRDRRLRLPESMHERMLGLWRTVDGARARKFLRVAGVRNVQAPACVDGTTTSIMRLFSSELP
jgi:hypothetical protein